jgi:hypothetical protein
MNLYFALAGGLALLLGLLHSVMGELLLFRRLTRDGLPPLAPFSLIEVRKMGLTGSPDLARRTLRFTWHLPTVLGGGLGAVLLRLSWPDSPGDQLAFVESAAALSFLASALIVLFCTRGKHPGWVAFLAIAILFWLGRWH